MEIDTEECISYLLPKDKINLESYKKTKQLFISKYGSDDKIANYKIAEELGANNRILFLINHGFKDNEETLLSKDIELKIRAYADQRTDTNGVLLISERLKKAKELYSLKKDPQFAINPKFDLWVICAK